jgi:anti-sigma-K factor RskA
LSAHDHSRLADDAGAYVLGALEPDEQRAFERHIESCPACRREIEQLAVAADALPRAVEQVDPPPSLKASLMATVAADARARRAPTRRARWRDRLLARPAFAAAAAALLLALGIGAGALVGALTGSDDQRVLSAQVDRSRAPAGTAELVLPDGADERGGAILRVRGMQQPPAGKVYEVWLLRGKRIERSSLFTVAHDGSGAAAIPERLAGVDEVMVTREPAGGSDQPSEEPLVRVPVRS